MARENQGLQYALIAFVLLTIILGVTTFVFFSQYRRANQRAAANEEERKRQAQAARTALEDAESLKRMMGFAPSDSMTTVKDRVEEDRLKYAGTYPEDEKFYHQLVERQAKDIKALNESLNDEMAKVKEQKEYITGLDKMMAQKIAPFQTAAEQARKEREGEASKFAADRERIKADQSKLAEDLTQTRKDKDATITERDSQMAKLEGDVKMLSDALEERKRIINRITDEKPEKFLGEVRWVNQQNRVVWINLGRDDALRPQISFSVFPAGAGDLVETDKKASIEVTEILGSHLAEARITEDRVTDPVLPGDRIFTPVWSLGEKRHFALAGFFDLDNNGQSDQELLETLIEMNGGAIDAKKDATGKRQGEINVNTRFLVVGESPGVTASQEDRKDYDEMHAAAEKLKVDLIPLEKFLDRMGWKRDVRILPYAKGSDRNFPVRVDQTPQVSSGKMSQLFKPRQPPRTSGGSTY